MAESSWRSEPAAALRGLANRRSPPFGLALVEPLKGGAAHIDLAAHLERIGEAACLDRLGDVADGADIGRDVLALIAVAAGRALNEAPLLVAERDGQAVDLGLGGEGQLCVRIEPEEAADALDEVAHAFVVEHVAERQHGHAVDDLAEGLDRRRAHFQRRAVVADETRKARLDGVVAGTQGVVLGVRDLRLVLPVVECVVMGDLGRKARKLVCGFRLGQRLRPASPRAAPDPFSSLPCS